MKDRSIPVFLERRSYRQRRLTDAARLLPVLGVLLWLVPLLWPQGGGGAATGAEEVAAVSMSDAVLYIFGVWVFLALASWLVSLMLDVKTGAQGDRRDDRLGDGPGQRDV